VKTSVTLAALVGATLLLMWPAFYNHQPFFFSDTTAYIRGVDAAMVKLFGVSSAWTQQESDLSSNPGHMAQDGHISQDGHMAQDKTVLAGRSVFYGTLVYLGDRSGGEWLCIGIQALVVVLALFGLLRMLGLQTWPHLIGLVAVLAAFTPLPLYASFLLPDVFTGLTILACALLLTWDLRRHRPMALGWFALLSASLTFHTTHALLAVLMAGVGLVLYLWRRSLVVPRGLVAIAGALVIAYLCGTAFTVGVTRLSGQPPLTPPFLMARLIDDGPGYDYLRDTCPGSGFQACRFVERLPMQSDQFLWSRDPKIGAFAVADPGVRRALSREQYRFALAVFAHEPLAQTAVSLRNALEQAFLLKLTEFEYTPEDKTTFAVKVPAGYFASMQTTPAYTGKMPILALSVLSYTSAAVGLAFLLFCFYSGRYRRARPPQQFMTLACWVLFGVFANAAVCGVLSGPHDRYQARVIWLIPAMALIAYWQTRRQRRIGDSAC
jgi:hypothetical protein